MDSLQGAKPKIRFVTKAFFSTLPFVRYYEGNPLHNTSGVPFPDAVCIWSGPGCNWREALNSIEINPDAGRAERETDCIPLRAEQINADPDELKIIASMINEGLLESEFVPLSKDLLTPISDEELSHTMRVSMMDLSKKSLAVFPGIMRIMQTHEPNGKWRYSDGSELICGGSLIYHGYPIPNIEAFDSLIPIRQLVLVPHLSSRGPNGAWLIRRGPNHKDIVELSKKHAFAIGTDLRQRSYTSDHPYESLELFSSMEDALEAARDCSYSESPLELNGDQILRLICQADVVEINHTIHIVSSWGLTCLRAYSEDQSISSLAELISSLPNRL